jgi:hypothetical protein
MRYELTAQGGDKDLKLIVRQNASGEAALSDLGTQRIEPMNIDAGAPGGFPPLLPAAEHGSLQYIDPALAKQPSDLETAEGMIVSAVLGLALWIGLLALVWVVRWL